MSDRKFNYGKAEADLYNAGCCDSEEIYEYRTERGINEFMRENGLNPEKYYEDDKSDNSDNSAENGSGTFGCFLTSACVEAKGLPDDCRELEILRSFRDNYLACRSDGKEEITRYYRIAPEIVKRINALSNAKEIWNRIYNELVIPSVEFIKSGKNEKAYAHYKAYTLSLFDDYM